jgi:hypothetical protein
MAGNWYYMKRILVILSVWMMSFWARSATPLYDAVLTNSSLRGDFNAATASITNAADVLLTNGVRLTHLSASSNLAATALATGVTAHATAVLASNLAAAAGASVAISNRTGTAYDGAWGAAVSNAVYAHTQHVGSIYYNVAGTAIDTGTLWLADAGSFGTTNFLKYAPDVYTSDNGYIVQFSATSNSWLCSFGGANHYESSDLLTWSTVSDGTNPAPSGAFRTNIIAIATAFSDTLGTLAPTGTLGSAAYSEASAYAGASHDQPLASITNAGTAAGYNVAVAGGVPLWDDNFTTSGVYLAFYFPEDSIGTLSPFSVTGAVASGYFGSAITNATADFALATHTQAVGTITGLGTIAASNAGNYVLSAAGYATNLIAHGGLTNATQYAAMGAAAKAAQANDTSFGQAANGTDQGAAVGYMANANYRGVSVGDNSAGNASGVGIGSSADGHNCGLAAGRYAVGADTNVSLGYTSLATGNRAIAIGPWATNNVADTAFLAGNLTQTGSIKGASFVATTAGASITGAVWMSSTLSHSNTVAGLYIPSASPSTNTIGSAYTNLLGWTSNYFAGATFGGTSNITVQQSGLYRVAFSVSGTATQEKTFEIAAFRNDTQELEQVEFMLLAGAAGVNMHGAGNGIVPLTSNDFVTVKAKSTDAGTSLILQRGTFNVERIR